MATAGQRLKVVSRVLLFTSQPAMMGRWLGIVCRAIATHFIKQAGLTQVAGRTGAAVHKRFRDSRVQNRSAG
ncbi:MAG: hypothetical protein V3S33_03805 [Gammaproteobacteria bacterium]